MHLTKNFLRRWLPILLALIGARCLHLQGTMQRRDSIQIFSALISWWTNEHTASDESELIIKPTGFLT